MLDKFVDKIENKILRYFVKGLANSLRVLLSILLFLLLTYVSFSYLNKSIREETSDYVNFHALPEDSIDVIVLGSSHAQYSFMPSLFNQQTGLYSYVLGSACQPYEVSYEMLKEALKTQSPELVIMEVFTATPLSSTCEGDSCYVTAGYIMSGQERYNSFDYLEEEKAISYRNDFLNNHNKWIDYESFSDILKKKEYTSLDIDKYFGYRFNTTELPAWNYWNPLKYSENIEVELDEIDVRMLNNIKNLCNENGIQLMLYMVPMDGIDVINQSYRYKIWEWCDNNDILYQDQVEMAESINYYMIIHNDGAHSYINGAAITTTELSNFVNEKFIFNSHKENEMLSKMLFETDCSSMIYIMKTEYDPLIYGKYYKGFKGLVIFRYANNGTLIDNKYRTYLLDLGIAENFDSNNYYYAIINNGELIHEQYEDGDFEYDGRVISFRDWGVDLDYNNIDYQGNLSVILFGNPDFYIVKSADTTKARIWETGYNFYGE